MNSLTEIQKKKLVKLLEFSEDKDTSMLKNIFEIQDKLNSLDKLEDLKKLEEIKNYLSSIQELIDSIKQELKSDILSIEKPADYTEAINKLGVQIKELPNYSQDIKDIKSSLEKEDEIEITLNINE